MSDLEELGFTAQLVAAGDNRFAVVPQYEVEIGRFVGRVIDLGILVTPDYPRTVASAIHIRANPQLLEKSDTVPNVRNITDSQLGPEWRYWSHNFQWTEERSTRRLISQINGIFKDA
ncbi:MAG TPA: E2/UBC family protein [Pyrinomonadaceae bacterium]|nr:E2/UBC family protein [Pyrinomonadaceae bacterium]